eukprot:scaffold5741_cov114-Isochrysis_galbana.AAC.3
MAPRAARFPARSRPSASATKRNAADPPSSPGTLCASSELPRSEACSASRGADSLGRHRGAETDLRLETKMWRARRAVLVGVLVGALIYLWDPVLWG